MSGWVDFKALRAKLKFETVLVHYKVEIRRKGDQHMGFCPLPGHGGNRRSPSFSAELTRGIFHCFGCQAQGNILDFAALMEGVSPSDGRGLRQVAARLQTQFCPELNRTGSKGRTAASEQGPQDDKPPELNLEVGTSVTNAPLDFELKSLDRSHPYLKSRNLVAETIADFGLGYSSKGSLAQRIAIPLHDPSGQLIGYAGRVIDDTKITEDNPRYQFPSKREREGRIYEFKKSLFLYNGHRFQEQNRDLVVVEGFASVWWITQTGTRRVVATMGAECSDEQAELIVSLVTPDAHVWIMPDGDKAGEKFAQSLLAKISPRRFVRWAKLQSGDQPTDLTAHDLRKLLSV